VFDWFGTDIFFYLQNGLIQTSQTEGEQYSDTSPLVFPSLMLETMALSALWGLRLWGRPKA
jgi:hypothetical protein